MREGAEIPEINPGALGVNFSGGWLFRGTSKQGPDRVSGISRLGGIQKETAKWSKTKLGVNIQQEHSYGIQTSAAFLQNTA